MGSSGMKRRRKGTGGGKSGTHPQHMAKVGTSREAAEHEQALERSAIADVMGLGNTPGWLKMGCLVVGALILIAAVVALIALD
jgi:hypothetical protein